MKGKILVIEDDKNWQAKLKKYLEVAGFYVEVESDLNLALKRVQKEIFHFITIDMQLDESNIVAEKFEGWSILETIKKLRVQDITPAMVITGFNQEYEALKGMKKLESIFFMYKGKFDRELFIDTVERAVKIKNLRFKDDHRNE